MNADKPDFYLAATEVHELQEPVKCWRVKRLRRKARWFQYFTLRPELRNDYLLIKTEPAFHIGDRATNEILVSSKGPTLFPITEWPVFVYVLETAVPNLKDRQDILDSELRVVDWAGLFPTEEDARRFI
ncbi:MAG TPA: hypothetical protein VF952_11930 [Chloroflexia bacterium]|jgi:hypothetical protein